MMTVLILYLKPLKLKSTKRKHTLNKHNKNSGKKEMELHLKKEDMLHERIESMAKTIADLRQQVKLKNEAIANLEEKIDDLKEQIDTHQHVVSQITDALRLI